MPMVTKDQPGSRPSAFWPFVNTDLDKRTVWARPDWTREQLRKRGRPTAHRHLDGAGSPDQCHPALPEQELRS